VKLIPMDICRATAAHFDMSLAELLGDNTERAVSRPRQIAMVMCQDYTGRSLANIARYFNRDHTSLLHAYGAVGPGTEIGKKTAPDRCSILARARIIGAARARREKEWVVKLHAGVAVLPPKPAPKKQVVIYDPRLFRNPVRAAVKPSWYARLGPSDIAPAPEKLRAGRA
jgi:hypothetical protein